MRIPSDNGIKVLIGLALALALALHGCAAKEATTQPSDTAVAQGDSSLPVEYAPNTYEMNELPGRVHYVQSKDTLWSLAERYYGNGKHWRKILVANRNRLSGSTDLPVGMRLIVP